MKALVIGGGGREHALVWKLAQSPHVSEVICAPGNGGTSIGKCHNAPIKADDIDTLIAFAERERPDLTIVGPEKPLCDGIVDRWPQGLRIWGPTAEMARLEDSKVYAKELMLRLGIPTARFFVCDSMDEAREAIGRFPGGRCVVKADGLCGGKGAVPCDNLSEAESAAYGMLVEGKLGPAGKRIVIEDYLDGWEASLMVLCAGGELIVLPTAQDYKRIFDGNQGPNTGGMGAYSPVEHFTPTLIGLSLDTIVRPLVEATGFQGVLYVGLMINENGIYVLEFNVRFGDPELQVILPRLRTDLVDILYAGAEGKFQTIDIKWASGACVTVVMASKDYPGKPRIGDVIEGLDRASSLCPDAIIFHAGTAMNEEGRIITSGGRVLNVTAHDGTKKLARFRVYRAIEYITWVGVQYRHDIAA